MCAAPAPEEGSLADMHGGAKAQARTTPLKKKERRGPNLIIIVVGV